MRDGSDLAWLGVMVLIIVLVASCGEMARRGGRAEACNAECGEHWVWKDRCVCLEVVDGE